MLNEACRTRRAATWSGPALIDAECRNITPGLQLSFKALLRE
jgi:hypothetical protein